LIFGAEWGQGMIRYLFIAAILTPSIVFAEDATAPAGRLLQGASEQIGKTLHYDPSYEALAFPGGDVPMERGVCTDVIIRAYRTIGVDLQLLVNQDIRQFFGAYPKHWGLSRPDPNIDHRRVPNLAVFLAATAKHCRFPRGRKIISRAIL
jgi:uncharacterized protein YijF (DUF1287 family)